MNILFLTRKFAPQNYIGAIRPTKISKYLTRLYGCTVDVICMRGEGSVIDTIGQQDIKDLHHVETLNPCKWTSKVKKWYSDKASKIKTGDSKIVATKSNTKEKKGFKTRINRSIINIVRNCLYLVSILDSYIYGRKVVNYLKTAENPYSAFFSTTFLIESYIVGKFLKKANPELRWIYDLRDPLRLDSYPGIAGYIMRSVLKKTVSLVDEVTGVSKACIAEFEETGHLNTQIIFNGFDEEDIKSICRDSAQNDTISIDKEKFKIVYTGSLYDGKRDVTPLLLLLLLDLNKELKIDLSKIEIHYAGKDIHVLENSIKKIGIDIKIIDHGFISREESIKLQLSADALLLLSWNNIGDTGVVTGKFYEYLMMNRPIICVLKGNVPKSILRQMIEETGAGTCYEEADKETHVTSKNYISTIYNNKFNNSNTFQRAVGIDEYNYKNIAGKIFQLCINN